MVEENFEFLSYEILNLDIPDRFVSLHGLGVLRLDLYSYWPRRKADNSQASSARNQRALLAKQRIQTS